MLWGYVIGASAALAGAFGTFVLKARDDAKHRQEDRKYVDRVAQKEAVTKVLEQGQNLRYCLFYCAKFYRAGQSYVAKDHSVLAAIGDATKELNQALAVADLTVDNPLVREFLDATTALVVGDMTSLDEPQRIEDEASDLVEMATNLGAVLAQLRDTTRDTYVISE